MPVSTSQGVAVFNNIDDAVEYLKYTRITTRKCIFVPASCAGDPSYSFKVIVQEQDKYPDGMTGIIIYKWCLAEKGQVSTRKINSELKKNKEKLIKELETIELSYAKKKKKA